MTQSDGEKELVLGNKQLISLFFVAVALCGVFFALGYMIGRNSTKGAFANPASAADSAAATGAAVGQAAQQQSEPPRETPAAQPDSPPPPVDQIPVQTKPAQDVPPSPASESNESKPPKSAAGNIGVTTTESGASYLQVTALPRADAVSVVRTLQEQSFPAILAESSKDGLFRVLVGPYRQTAQLAEAKARLKTLGFANAFVQRQ